MTASICLKAGKRGSDGPRPRFLPAPLINARAAVLNRQFCQDLSSVARKALYGVLAFFSNERPDQPVFAYRDTLQGEALIDSRASLYRGLQEAEEKGYIRREQIRTWGARCYGQFSRSHIYLLDKALVMLGLAEPRNPSETPATSAPPCSDASLDRLVQEEIITEWEESRTEWEDDESCWEDGAQPLKPPAVAPRLSYPQEPCLTMRHGLQDGEPTLGLQLKGQLLTRERIPDPSSLKDSSENTIDPQTRLPQEVIPLLKLGVSKTLICALMAHAKRQGQQGVLGAAVKLFWDNIQELRGRSVFAYLRKILSQKRDYAYLLKQQAASEIEGVLTVRAATRLSDKLAMLLARCDGWLVRNADGQTLGTLIVRGESGYIEGVDRQRGRIAMPANLRFVQAIEEGRLHLRAAP